MTSAVGPILPKWFARLVLIALLVCPAAAWASSTPGYPPCLSLVALDGAIRAGWCEPDDGGSAITGYVVWYGQTATPTTNPIQHWISYNHNSTTKTYTIPSLTNGKRYGVRIQAVNANGGGGLSTTIHVNLATTKPTTPTGLTATGGDSSVALKWSHSDTSGSAITKWEYKKAEKPAGQSDFGDYGDWADICQTINDSKCPGKRAHTVSGLTNGTTYKFEVRAVNAKGDSDADESGEATPSTTPAKPTGLTATAGNGTVTLSWTAGDNGGSAITGWKYIKKTGDNWDSDWTAVPGSGADTTSYTVPNLSSDTAYKFKVRAVNANGDGAESDESASVTPLDETLTASGVTHNSATLTIGNHSGDWYYKANAAPDASCSSTAVSGNTKSLTGLSGNTSYAYKAYSDSGCTSGNLLATASAFLTKPGKPAKPTATAGTGSGKLTLASSVTGGGTITGWQYTKDDGANWSDISSTSTTLSYVVENLTDGTDYTFKVRAKNATGTGPDSDASDAAAPTDETLAASSVTYNSATLTIGNHSGDWYYKANAAPDASCSTTAVSGNTKSLTGLSGNTSYTYKAYSDSGCTSGNLLATASAFLTKPGKPAKPTATAGAGSGKLTLSSSVTGGGTISKWQYTKDDGANWTDIDVTSTTLSYIVENLTDGTNYTFKVRAANATGTGPDSDASDAASPADETLAASSVTHNSATLTIGGHSGDWYYKANAAPDASCSTNAVSGTTKDLTGLSGNTSYAYKAYSDSGCNAELAAAAAFLTKPGKPAKPTATAGAGSGKLTLSSSVTGGGTIANWQYTKDNGANWTDINVTSTTLSYVVENLTDGTNYTFKVRAKNATGTGPDSDASDAAAATDETLTASGVTHDSATLTIGGHSGDWYYKANAAPHASCSTNAVSGTTKDLTGLSGNTSYAYKAYSDSSCNAELAAAGAFLTKPGKPAKPTATSGAGSGKLTLASSVTGGGAITGWQYTKDNGANWSNISSTSTSLSYVVESLTDGTDYAFKVRAVNATGTGPDSDASDAAAPASETLTVSNITKNGATLTIGNHPGNWHYKHASGTCSSEQIGTTASVTGLAANTSYTFTAYSDRCTTAVAAAAAFPTLPPKPAKPTAAAGAGSGKLTLASSVTGDADLTGWEYKKKPENGSFDPDWTSVTTTSRTLSHVVSDLTNGTNYVFKVRAVNASGDGAESDESDAAAPLAPSPPNIPVTPPDETLAASGVTHDSATLTIGHHSGNWYYKANAAPHASCSSSAVSGATKNLTGLSGNTSYTYKAYGDSGCNTELASAPAFLTKPGKPAKPTASPGAGSGKLTLASSVSGGGAITGWQYTKDDGANWTDIDVASTTLSYTVENLTDGTDYAFKVRAVNATGTGPDSDASDAAAPSDETLTASGVTHDSATLTIGNHSGEWYYKANAAPHASCSSTAVTTNSTTLSNLSGNTSYTYRVYGDSGCNTELASAPAFLTKPGKPAKPTATAGPGGGEITLASSVTGGGAISNWQYTKDNGANWTDINVASTTLSYTVESLTDGTDYAFKVRAVNATGTGPDSDASDAAQPMSPPMLSASAVRETTATLRIANWTAAWWYRGNQQGAQCTSVDANTATATLSNLTAGASYVYTVYSVSGCASANKIASVDFNTSTAPPLAPSKPGVAAGDARVALSWTPGGDGGSAVTKWQYRQRAGTGGYGAWTDVPGSGASTTSHTVTGLTSGTAYRFRVRAVNAVGAGRASPESDSVTPLAPPVTAAKGWLARFGRAAGSQAVEMLTGRMNAPAPGGSRMTLGGQTVDLNEDLERLLAKQGGASGGLARWGTAGGPASGYHETTVSELLRGGSFHLASAQEAEAVPGGRWSMWGRGARTSFEGASAVEGDVTTAMLGMDYEKGGVLMGVALARSTGEGGFGNAGVEAKLTSAHPYLRFALNERISAWGVLGVGRGEMTLEEKGRKIETDLDTRMAAFGVRGELAKAAGFDLALKSDALLAQVGADAADGLSAVSAEATRLRVMLEASRAVAMKGGGRFTPSVEAGLRHDGGDADEGIGVEVGGSLHFTNPAWGLTLELRARGLITHEGEDAADWGAGGTLRIAPGEAGRGLALTVEPAVGETAGGIARLWSVEDASRLAGEEAGDMDPRVRAEVGYGLDAWGGLLTPYAGLSASEDGGAYRLGGRFRIGESLSMSVEGGVREREDDGPVHGVALRGSLRW